jgi:signal transduction histidine kinase
LIGCFTAWRAFRRQQQLAEMKGNFVSAVSHELRAPIASIRLMSEELEDIGEQTPAKRTEYHRLITQECRRLSSLIENVLDFSRHEQGRKEYAFEPTDLVALVVETVKLMQPCGLERCVALATTFCGTVLPAEADGRALQQALINLIDNAIKHSPDGATVTVGLEFPASDTKKEERRNGHEKVTTSENVTRNPKSAKAAGRATLAGNVPVVCLWVEDHGEGIPPEEHARIFDRFYRRGSELRRETQGIGLGLAIVKYVAEAHGGKVTVGSVVGEGSRFTLVLPVVNHQEAA